MKQKRIHLLSLLSVILFLLLSQTSFSIEKKPVKVKESDKCKVCGMFVSKYTNWIAQIIFNDGSYAVFDGPKDMFRYYLNLSKYNPSKKQTDISAVFVTEYYSAKIMEANNLFFVLGSDVLGPMGYELIPVASEQNAKEFLKDHNGKKILKFEQITLEALK
ncbi:MAG: nitrous oxide reductase accessory protein NosL [Nitrospirae bacterium GWC2_42_7]|nr:MAG: nitrous oxide reductase accessory protein NosL [Nitrospirae bacterium GWC2_42_7]